MTIKQEQAYRTVLSRGCVHFCTAPYADKTVIVEYSVVLKRIAEDRSEIVVSTSNVDAPGTFEEDSLLKSILYFGNDSVIALRDLRVALCLFSLSVKEKSDKI